MSLESLEQILINLRKKLVELKINDEKYLIKRMHLLALIEWYEAEKEKYLCHH